LSKLSVNTAGSKDCPTEILKGYSNTNWFDAGVLEKMRKTPSLPKENKIKLLVSGSLSLWIIWL
jgi:hypothetical protein